MTLVVIRNRIARLYSNVTGGGPRPWHRPAQINTRLTRGLPDDARRRRVERSSGFP
jgi:hypothetical protein